MNLLGLQVNLDNCNNGRVTVNVTAVPGAGNLLGNLLCDLSHLLDSQASQHAINLHLARILDVLQGLIG